MVTYINNTIDVTSIINNIVNSLVNIVLAVCAIIGVCIVNSWHEKQIEASFGFLSKLKCGVTNIKSMANNENLKPYILNRYLPETSRKSIIDMYASMADGYILVLSQRASDVLTFLMNENNQLLPSYRNKHICTIEEWNNKISLLIEFFTDFELMKNKVFCKFLTEQQSVEYFDKNIKNLGEIIDIIEKVQKLTAESEGIKE